jgi:hypothetical protein
MYHFDSWSYLSVSGAKKPESAAESAQLKNMYSNQNDVSYQEEMDEYDTEAPDTPPTSRIHQSNLVGSPSFYSQLSFGAVISASLTLAFVTILGSTALFLAWRDHSSSMLAYAADQYLDVVRLLTQI